MSELEKLQSEEDLLSAITSVIAVAFAVGLPMAAVIIWACS